MTKPLSPAAQAVLDAFFTGDWEDEPLHANIVRALRAAAEGILPLELSVPANVTTKFYHQWEQRCDIRCELLAIAAELEAH